MYQSERRATTARRLRVWGMLLVALYVIVQFAAFRASLNRIPVTWTVAGEPFPDQAIDEVVARIQTAFDTPVVLYYYDEMRALPPEAVDFKFDATATAAALRREREQFATTGNFLRRLIFQPPAPRAAPIVAEYSQEKIRLKLSEMALAFDKPAQPPAPNLSTMTLSPGQSGYLLDIAASVKPVADALTSIRHREVELIVDPQSAPAPSIDQLRELMQERLKGFTGNASVFFKDLRSGDEVLINTEVAYSGMSLMKIPIMTETYRQFNQPPDVETLRLLTETLGSESGNFTANLLLRQLGEGDAFVGVDRLTSSLRYLGLTDTFMATPYDQENVAPPNIVTPANARTDVWANPDPYMQTTPGNIGLLLEMIYQCSQGGGALLVAYPGAFTPDECRQMLDIMQANVITDAEGIPTLLRGGLPEGTPFAHKHGWDFDTRADASIAFTSGGDFVLVVFLNTPQVWVEWDVANSVMVDLARAGYNYFNPVTAGAQPP
ncbi:MAG TPA: serine hydrolase [Anaerolineae bacterium]|nr:serine hydrolase [Anaerolineae bacterium]